MSKFGTWTKLSDGFPDPSTAKYVLAYRIYTKHYPQYHIADTERIGPYTSNDGKTRSHLRVYNSICPPIYDDIDQHSHWMYLPDENDPSWKIPVAINEGNYDLSFNQLGLPNDISDFIGWLHNGSCYVLENNGFYFSTSFNTFTDIQKERLYKWTELPKPPQHN